MKGVVLFGHGSRDPAWRAPIEAVAARVAGRAPGVPVRCAYLELCAPDLATAAAELAALGVDELRILPMFLGLGRHAREDLPALARRVRAQHPDLAVQVLPPVGEHPRALELFAELALL
ncbi:sirohydrochlorin chelatase [Pseudorhodoferax sp.]|uniref:sirohydrochlorin chelatase n=1 Tax=Pseudorhodoferax sp. TaxID=1993553 RepID=UPI0039E3A23D